MEAAWKRRGGEGRGGEGKELGAISSFTQEKHLLLLLAQDYLSDVMIPTCYTPEPVC